MVYDCHCGDKLIIVNSADSNNMVHDCHCGDKHDRNRINKSVTFPCYYNANIAKNMTQAVPRLILFRILFRISDRQDRPEI